MMRFIASSPVNRVSVGSTDFIVTELELLRPFFVYVTVAVKSPTTVLNSFVRNVTDEELLAVTIEHGEGVHVQE